MYPVQLHCTILERFFFPVLLGAMSYLHSQLFSTAAYSFFSGCIVAQRRLDTVNLINASLCLHSPGLICQSLPSCFLHVFPSERFTLVPPTLYCNKLRSSELIQRANYQCPRPRQSPRSPPQPPGSPSPTNVAVDTLQL